MNFKKILLALLFGAAALAIVLGVCTALPREAGASVIFFGGLGLTALLGVLLAVPFCLLLVKYLKK